MRFINCTPHKISLNDGRNFEPSGSIPRVSQLHGEVVDDVATTSFGEVEGLPEPEEGVLLIVSALVLGASKRGDLVAPATNHPLCKRNDKGFVISVPCFVRAK